MFPIRQNATHKISIGPVVAVGDGFTPVTTLAVSSADEAEAILHDNATVVDISGYTFAAIATSDGYYHLTLQSGISGTVGHLRIVINDDSLCLPVKEDFMVMEEAAYDAFYAAAAPGYVVDQPVNVTKVAGTTQTAGDLAALVVTADAAIDTAVADLANGTDGLGALKVLIDAVNTDLSNGTDGLGALKTLIDAVNTDLSNGTDGLGALKVLIDAVNTDLSNGTDGLGALKALLDAIPTTPMRGTDSAALASEVTSERMATLTDWINGGRLDLLVDAIKAKTDNLPTDPADQSLIIAATDAIVTQGNSAWATATGFSTFNAASDAVANVTLVATTTTLTGHTAQTGDNYARLGAPAGASLSADVAAVKVDTAASKVTTDKITFTTANQVDANTLAINSATIVGDGNAVPFDGA